MKKQHLLALIFLCFVIAVNAQSSNAIFFTENGERFQVVLNGILQNAKAETNVKLTGLNAPNYKSRIIFEDTKLGIVDFNLYFPNPAIEVTWNIKKNKKGEYVVRYVSDIPIAQAPPPPATQTVVVYSTTPPPPVSSTTTTTTTTVNGTGGSGDNVNINMGVNMSENGGGVNINMSGTDGYGSTATTTTTTTTHSSSSTTTSVSDAPAPPAQVVYVDGYNGPIGCVMPMQNGDFSSAKQSIQSKSFEESKLTIAKQVFNNNCLTCTQVKEIMLLFSFEESKLDFAKYAYGYTYDTGNYYKVNDAFTFESSIEDLNNYISGYKR